MFCYHVSLWRVDGKYTLSGEILAQMAQNENFVRQSNKNMRQKYQKAQKSTLRQIKSAPKFLHLRYTVTPNSKLFTENKEITLRVLIKVLSR